MGDVIALIVVIALIFAICFVIFLILVYVTFRYIMPWMNYLMDNEDRWEQEFMIRRMTRKGRENDTHRNDNSGAAADPDNPDT